MHTDFSEWYRLAGIEPNSENLPKRWAAIEAYDPSHSDVISLARLFYRLGKPKTDFLTRLLRAFQEADPAFKTRDNDHELSLLAGAELVKTMIHSAPVADLAALSLVCAAGANVRPCPS